MRQSGRATQADGAGRGARAGRAGLEMTGAGCVGPTLSGEDLALAEASTLTSP